MAKTLVVKVPEDLVGSLRGLFVPGEAHGASPKALKRLIDKTAEFVADDGWEFDAWR